MRRVSRPMYDPPNLEMERISPIKGWWWASLILFPIYFLVTCCVALGFMGAWPIEWSLVSLVCPGLYFVILYIAIKKENSEGE